MPIQIRSAKFPEDRSRLVAFLREFLAPLSSDRRFDWLYLENPAGQALIWLATNAADGALIGAAAAFPRRICAHGRVLQGFVLGDFCIHPSFRALGPALQLQRACLEVTNYPASERAYDFPSESMSAVYRRLGVEPQDQMVRMAKPLRVDRKIASSIKSRVLARSLIVLGNRALKWRRGRPRIEPADEIGWHEGPCNVEFTGLAAETLENAGVCVVRDAPYLNWRFLSHPVQKFEILTARKKNALIGYLILTQEDQDVRIVDLLGTADTRILRNLVLHAAESARERGAMTISASVLGSHRYMKLFESLGFRRRESCPVFLFPSAAVPSRPAQVSTHNWLLMDGDRES
jgi:hypothetical protein